MGKMEGHRLNTAPRTWLHASAYKPLSLLPLWPETLWLRLQKGPRLFRASWRHMADVVWRTVRSRQKNDQLLGLFRQHQKHSLRAFDVKNKNVYILQYVLDLICTWPLISCRFMHLWHFKLFCLEDFVAVLLIFFSCMYNTCKNKWR